jgi:hypothetical protein
VERAAQVALPVPAAQVVLLRQAARPEPQATQAARIAVRMFSPLAVQAKMLSTRRGQELGRDLIRVPSINNSIWLGRRAARVDRSGAVAAKPHSRPADSSLGGPIVRRSIVVVEFLFPIAIVPVPIAVARDAGAPRN